MYKPIFCSSTDRHVSYLRAELPSQGEEGRKGSSMGKRQVTHKALIMCALEFLGHRWCHRIPTTTPSHSYSLLRTPGSGTPESHRADCTETGSPATLRLRQPLSAKDPQGTAPSPWQCPLCQEMESLRSGLSLSSESLKSVGAHDTHPAVEECNTPAGGASPPRA